MSSVVTGADLGFLSPDICTFSFTPFDCSCKINMDLEFLSTLSPVGSFRFTCQQLDNDYISSDQQVYPVIVIVDLVRHQSPTSYTDSSANKTDRPVYSEFTVYNANSDYRIGYKFIQIQQDVNSDFGSWFGFNASNPTSEAFFVISDVNNDTTYRRASRSNPAIFWYNNPQRLQTTGNWQFRLPAGRYQISLDSFYYVSSDGSNKHISGTFPAVLDISWVFVETNNSELSRDTVVTVNIFDRKYTETFRWSSHSSEVWGTLPLSE